MTLWVHRPGQAGDWLRLGRDVVGQQTQVTVVKNRFGPPGRQVDLEIHYVDGGERHLATHGFAKARPVELRPVEFQPVEFSSRRFAET